MAIFDVPLSDLRARGTIKWRRFEPDVLPMFVAEMDAHLAPAVRERLERALREGDTGYPQLPTYQEAFADYSAWQWGWRPEMTEMKLATDVVTGMRDALEAVSEPGDGVVINAPIYPPFRGVSHDRTLIDVPMKDGRLDLEGLAEAFARHRPAAYLLCSPHNPVGTIHTADELAEVARLAAEYGVAVISDEIHAPLAGAAHVPYLAVPGAANAVIVTSASKSWNLAALKAALIVGDPAVLARLGAMVSDGASYFGVLAHAAALTDARDWVAEAAAEIAANKEFFRAQLAEHLPQLSYEPAPGTYLAWLDCAPLGLENPGVHFHEVARVRFNLGTDFAPTATQHVRVNLATSKEIIAEAVARMSASIQPGG
ncbi:MAG: aminotransferase class I/II-fold pyridoxal phosphate-dependent enzyme [Arachnia sp.]